MGSIQENNSVSIEMASESRHVEMREGAGDGALNATDGANGDSDAHLSRSKEHVINGHVMHDEKGENRASHSPANSSNGFHHSSIPIASVEKYDDAASSSTAADPEERVLPSQGEQTENLPFPSPTLPRHQSSNAHTSESIKLENEIARLNRVLSETSAQAAQRVLHEKWRFFLFDQYDESHISFILRAGLKNALPNVLEKVLRDNTIFKDHFLDVASKKPGVIEKVMSNATVSQLGYLPQRILDKAVAERLKSVGAKQLIKWLAEADRLGYKLDDIIDEDDESVVPNHDIDMTDVFEVEPAPPRLASSHAHPLLTEQELIQAAQRTAALKAEAVRQQQKQQQLQQPQQIQQPQQPPPTRPKAANLDINNLRCPTCNARFTAMSGYNYHITKKPCQKQAPLLAGSKWWCMNCIQAFTTKQGMDGHKERKVCFDDDIAPPTSPSNQLHQEAQSRSQPPKQQYGASILPPPRPSFAAQTTPPQQISAPHPTSYPQPQPRPPISVQRPPLHTPTPAALPAPTPTPSVPTQAPKEQSIPINFRQSPSELSPEKLAALDRELQEAEDRYQQLVAEIPADYTEAERNHRLTSLKNAKASRKSQIRKAHGVSLRLREKDKLAREAARITPPGRPLIGSRAPAPPPAIGTPATTTPTPSFSPVNAPSRSGPSPSEYGRHGSPPNPSQVSQHKGPSGDPSLRLNASHYKPPTQDAAVRVQNTYSEPHPNTLTHPLENRTPASGLNTLRIPSPQPVTSTTYLLSNTSNKRRRSLEDDGRPNQPRPEGIPSSTSFAANLSDQNSTKKSPNQPYTPPLSMIQVQTEDATSKLAKTPPLAKGQVQPSPSRANDRDTPMTENPHPPTPMQNPKALITNTKETPITILSSSESESEHEPVAATPKLPPAMKISKKQTEQETSGNSTGDEEVVSDEERSEKEWEKMMEQRRRSGNMNVPGVRRGFMAKRGRKR